MYLNYFGLTDKPFSITPDPRFLYLSEKHREGLAHLLYGADQSGSFVVLTGEVGTGKTTLCRSMLTKAPEKVVFALILNPLQSPLELLASICDEFHIDYPRGSQSQKALVDALNTWLLDVHARGERAVVIIDEAQNLGVETLEQVRLLTNLETSSEKLLKIILIGQPELKAILARPDLRQLNQRITARYHLEPLAEEDAGNYVAHRLKIAGAARNVFSAAAVKAGYRLAGGIPRLMNLIFDRALTGAYGANQTTIEAPMVKRAAKELFAAEPGRRPAGPRHTAMLATAASVAVLAIAATLGWQRLGPGRLSTSGHEAAQAASAPPPVDAPATEHAIATATLPDSTVEPAIVEVSAAAPAVFNLDDVLSPRANNSNAFNALFWLWGLNFADYPGDSACERARRAGYRCLFGGDGTFSRLREADLPAVLELKTRDGDLRQITLAKASDTDLTVNIAGEGYRLQPNEIASLWNGNYMLIWPVPPGESLTLAPGERGSAILWLREQLGRAGIAEVTGENPSSDLFDSALRDRVIAFQQLHNLSTDGIAGEQTLLRLATAVYQNQSRPESR